MLSLIHAWKPPLLEIRVAPAEARERRTEEYGARREDPHTHAPEELYRMLGKSQSYFGLCKEEEHTSSPINTHLHYDWPDTEVRRDDRRFVSELRTWDADSLRSITFCDCSWWTTSSFLRESDITHWDALDQSCSVNDSENAQQTTLIAVKYFIIILPLTFM